MRGEEEKRGLKLKSFKANADSSMSHVGMVKILFPFQYKHY